MRYFSRRPNSSSYSKLWAKSGQRTSVQEDPKTEEEVLIETLILKADLCSDLETYVETLCEGMRVILANESLLRVALKNDHFESKVKRIGSDIIDKSRRETDLFYLGVFASLKLKENWLDKQLYSVLSNLLAQVLNKGFEFSAKLRKKIKAKLVNFLVNEDKSHELAHLASMMRYGQ